MKQITLFIVGILLVSSVSAQDFFVKAGFGVGTSGSSFKEFSADAYSNSKSIPSGQGQLSIGATHGNLQMEMGIGYLQTGVSFMKKYGEPLCGIPGMGPTPIAEVVPNVRYTIQNSHIVMPWIISYAMNKQKKISFYPGIGLEGMYNLKGVMKARGADAPDVQPVINYKYNPLGITALVKFDVQYRISKSLSVWASPSYQQMLTSLTKKVQGDYMSRTYDHAILFNVGVKYDLHCPFNCPFHCGNKTVNN